MSKQKIVGKPPVWLGDGRAHPSLMTLGRTGGADGNMLVVKGETMNFRETAFPIGDSPPRDSPRGKTTRNNRVESPDSGKPASSDLEKT